MNIQDFAVPPEDRPTFVKFLAYLARIDGAVTVNEKQAVDSLIFAWNLTEEEIVEIYEVLEHGASIQKLTSDLKSKKSGYLLVQELITLAALDGNYCEDERKAVRDIAARCGVSESRVMALENWVEEGIAWRKKGLTLITPETSSKAPETTATMAAE